jgi:hypothetical protein
MKDSNKRNFYHKINGDFHEKTNIFGLRRKCSNFFEDIFSVEVLWKKFGILDENIFEGPMLESLIKNELYERF